MRSPSPTPSAASPSTSTSSRSSLQSVPRGTLARPQCGRRFRARGVARILRVHHGRRPQMKIACVLGQGFEDSEFRVPYDRLRKEGYQVDIIGVKAGEELKGYKGKEKGSGDKATD